MSEIECGPQPCETCGGSGQIQVGMEWDTNSPVCRDCHDCGGLGDSLTSPARLEEMVGWQPPEDDDE